jgi:peptidyl-prolyl cis-trans isomerase B (cyclophilin B)
MRYSGWIRVNIVVCATIVLTLGVLSMTGCLVPEQRDDALSSLARWEDRRLADTDSLIAMLADNDAHVRLSALRAAGRIGRTDVVREVIAGLDDTSDAVKTAAAEALGYLGDESAVEPLTRALNTGSARVREAVLFALARLSHDGRALIETALHGPEREATLAWNALRDRAADTDSTLLADTIHAGLVRPETAVLWRVLRCAERLPGRDLVVDIAAFTTADQAQVRVHACRALARMGGDTALAAVLDCGDRPGRFSRRDSDRISIAVMNALGTLGREALVDEADHVRLVALLASGSRHESTHVARAALAAMARAVDDKPLPAAAAARESLLPVWRIRLLHSARAQLMPVDEAPEPEAVVRAAAVTACLALRGAGLVSAPAWTRIESDEHALVRQAVWTGLCRHVLTPADVIDRSGDVGDAMPPALRMTACGALVEAGERFHEESHPDSTLALLDDVIQSTLRRVLLADDPQAAANAADLLTGYASDQNLIALLRAHTSAGGLSGVDMKRSVLGLLSTWLADSTYVPADTLRAPLTDILEAGFDAPEIHIRLAAREAAQAGDLFAPALIPSEASLRATLPAYIRHPDQGDLALPFAPIRVRCRTDRGDFVMELDPQMAPNTCATFLTLIADGFYDGLTFHRVVPDFVIQGGDPSSTGWGGPGFTIRSEWSRIPYERGTVGIAHSGKDTGGSQFFVGLSPQPHLNGRYTVFGKVVKGMEVAETVQPGDTFHLLIEE